MKSFAFSLFFIMFSINTQNCFGQITCITPDDIGSEDFFGFVMDMSDGQLLATAFNANGEEGAVYVYEKINGEWEVVQRISPEGIENNINFGTWAAIEGNNMVIASHAHPVPEDNTGVIYFYQKIDNQWQSAGSFRGPTPGSFFGWQVDHDGNNIIVGAPAGLDAAGINTGAAYIISFNPEEGWQQSKLFLPDDGESNDFFGGSVYLKGNLALVGARNDDETAVNSGAVYVYEFDGTTWNLSTKIKPEDVSEQDQLSYRVSASNSGDRIVLSGFGPENEAGAAYIYEKSGEDWVSVARLKSDDLKAGDWFGSSIGIEGDRVVVGARFASGASANTGAVYIFQETEDGWQQTHKFYNEDGNSDDRFGGGIFLSGNDLFVGAFLDDKAANNGGALYHIDLSEITSIIELAKEELKMFPNPTHDILNLDVENQKVNKAIIYNTQGQQVGVISLNGTSINVANLSDGNYILKLITESGQVLSSKFIKL